MCAMYITCKPFSHLCKNATRRLRRPAEPPHPRPGMPRAPRCARSVALNPPCAIYSALTHPPPATAPATPCTAQHGKEVLASLQQHIAGKTLACSMRPRTSPRPRDARAPSSWPQAKYPGIYRNVPRAGSAAPHQGPPSCAGLQHESSTCPRTQSSVSVTDLDPRSPRGECDSTSPRAPRRHSRQTRTRETIITDQAPPRRPSRRAHARRRGRAADTTTVTTSPPMAVWGSK